MDTMQVVHVRVNDAGTGKPTPVRIRFMAPDGTYLSPLGRAALPLDWRKETGGGSVVLGEECHAYIDGTCEIRLPTGPINVCVAKGPEYEPLRHTFDRAPGQIALRLNIARRFNLHQEGWYAGDTGVHFLSPHAAWLEGSAEGLQVVNVLATQSRPEKGRPFSLFRNLLDFSGQEPAYARDGCLVVVNTQNHGGNLGILSLLNCHRVVFPLSLEEEGFEKWALLDWCEQCHRKNGLVVWPDAYGGYCPPYPSDVPLSAAASEHVADLILGGIDAVEWSGGGRFSERLQEWYLLLNAGFHVPIVGGSEKSSGTIPVGAVRTYAQLQPGEEFNYKNWIEAIRGGRTFATRGPILRLTVNGLAPGAVFDVEQAKGDFAIQVTAESVVPFERVELVCNGEVIADAAAEPDLTASLSLAQSIQKPAWLAARCWGRDGLLAHTSPVYLMRAGRGISDPSAVPELLEHLDTGAKYFQGTIENPHRREHVLTIFASARKLLEERLQASG